MYLRYGTEVQQTCEVVESALNVGESDIWQTFPSNVIADIEVLNVIENASKLGSKLSESAINCDRSSVVVNIEIQWGFPGGQFRFNFDYYDATSDNFRTLPLVFNICGRSPFHLRCKIVESGFWHVNKLRDRLRLSSISPKDCSRDSHSTVSEAFTMYQMCTIFSPLSTRFHQWEPGITRVSPARWPYNKICVSVVVCVRCEIQVRRLGLCLSALCICEFACTVLFTYVN